MNFVINPIFTLHNVSPRPNIGQSLGKRIYIAVNPVNPRYGLCQPVGGYPPTPQTAPHQKGKNLHQKVCMFARRCAAKIGNAANIPQQAHPLRAVYHGKHLGHPDQRFQRRDIIGVARARQPVIRRRRFEAADQPICRAIFQNRITPVQFADGQKAMVFNGVNNLVIQWPCIAGDAKAARLRMTPCPPGNLGEFMREQAAHPVAIKLGSR